MIKIENGQVFSSEGKHIHRKGSECYYLRATVLKSDTVDDFEEVDSLPAYTEEQYKEKVRHFIAQRYCIEDELAIHRQREQKPEQWARYDAFCEECKVKAREELSAEDFNQSQVSNQTE